jgi:hypothetical protein
MSKGFEVVVRPIKGTLLGKCFHVKTALPIAKRFQA